MTNILFNECLVSYARISFDIFCSEQHAYNLSLEFYYYYHDKQVIKFCPIKPFSYFIKTICHTKTHLIYIIIDVGLE